MGSLAFLCSLCFLLFKSRFLNTERAEVAEKMGARWTESDERFLQENAGTLSSAQIGRRLHRSAEAVQRRAARLGVSLPVGVQCHQPWSDAEIATLQAQYRKMNTTDLAKLLGRERKQVFNKAFLLGLCVKQRINHAELLALVQRLHPMGYSDEEIAQEFGTNRHTVSLIRQRLGLGSNALSQHRRDRVRQKTSVQLAAAGVANLGELRRKVYQQRAAAAGWPADLRPRAVQILNVLWERGPMTRKQIAEAIGMPWKGSRKSLVSNDPDGSYLAHLAARGLVIRLGRLNKVTGQGQGRSTNLYSLPLWVERRAQYER